MGKCGEDGVVEAGDGGEVVGEGEDIGAGAWCSWKWYASVFHVWVEQHIGLVLVHRSKSSCVHLKLFFDRGETVRREVSTNSSEHCYVWSNLTKFFNLGPVERDIASLI